MFINIIMILSLLSLLSVLLSLYIVGVLSLIVYVTCPCYCCHHYCYYHHDHHHHHLKLHTYIISYVILYCFSKIYYNISTFNSYSKTLCGMQTSHAQYKSEPELRCPPLSHLNLSRTLGFQQPCKPRSRMLSSFKLSKSSKSNLSSDQLTPRRPKRSEEIASCQHSRMTRCTKK